MMGASVLAIDDPVLHEFAELVGAEGAVSVAGGRTRWEAGGTLSPEAQVVEAPTGIVSYRPEEMTMQVRAGTTVAELDAALAEKGQRSALADRGGTVGGAVAVGESSVDQLGRGAVRDSVLQVRYVSAEGKLVTGGGPVVKNVSGFNLPKLLTGSLGTLGLLAEIIIRTNPMPPASVWLRCEGLSPARARDAVLTPSAVLWDGGATWVHLEGHAVDVRAEQKQLMTLGSCQEVGGPPPIPAHRWTLSPAQAAAFSASEPFLASIGVGRVWASAPQPALPVDPVAELIGQRTKQLFDPASRLNPGRTP